MKSVRPGCGLRFNCAEAPVEGFSSPQYLAALVVGALFTHKIVTLTQVLRVAAMGGMIFVAILAAAA